jgi:hypothetical protein
MNTLNEQKVTLDPKLFAIPPQGVEGIVFVTSCTFNMNASKTRKDTHETAAYVDHR